MTGGTMTERCSCGARIDLSVQMTGTLIELVQGFREAHRVCREASTFTDTTEPRHD
jgi:hypothetical protein